MLNQELRTLLNKLRVSFDPFAAMWETVGFNRPGFASLPTVPSKLSAVLMGTSALIKWSASKRAVSYRVWKKVLGVDEEFVFVESRDALDFLFEGLPAGKTIQIVISAVNSGGESAKSEVVTVVTA